MTIKIEYDGKTFEFDLENPSEELLAEAIKQVLAEDPGNLNKGFRDTMKDGSLGPEMVSIPGGMFTMGWNGSNYSDEKPEHEVNVKPFSAGKYQVSFEEYDKFCEATGRDKPDDRGWGRGQRPVINVSWEDAKAYCAWLSEETGENYRLLTEEEWEYSCKAGDENGGMIPGYKLNEIAWYQGNSNSNTQEVGQKKPNAFGLYDMIGNVWEWVEDWYQSNWYKVKGAKNG